VIGAVAGGHITAVWTEDGDLFTFGEERYGQLGHGEHLGESMPRLVDALVGKKVVGASLGFSHTVVSTEAGEIFTFGDGCYGQLGHGGAHRGEVPSGKW
jgi:alpha-tubulin suppressor-like RCC1 family protein